MTITDQEAVKTVHDECIQRGPYKLSRGKGDPIIWSICTNAVADANGRVEGYEVEFFSTKAEAKAALDEFMRARS